MKRFIKLNNKDRSAGLKLTAAGVVIFLVLLGLELALPLYYPNYNAVENIFHENFKQVSLQPGKGVLVTKVNVSKADNTLIAFIDNQNDAVNVTVVGNGNTLTNAVDFTETLPQGEYSIYLLDTASNPYTVGFTYGVFKDSYISGFYSGLGIYQTILEIGMSLGAVLAIIGLILFLVSFRKH